MVELDKIISERSDERIMDAIKTLPDPAFGSLVDKVMGYLELKPTRSRTRDVFVIADCVHRTDDKKYTVFFSRREEPIEAEDVGNLLEYMQKTGADSALVFTVSYVVEAAEKMLAQYRIGFADGPKLAALLRRFDLDKEVFQTPAPIQIEEPKVPERVTISGDDLEVAMRTGYEALAAKDYMTSLEAFDRAITLDETYDVPWRLKGNTLDEMGYHEQALECYKRALELLPESDETWFSLGNCFFALSRYSEEIMCYDRALFYNPLMQKALINKGSTLHKLGRYPEALEAYDKVLKMNYRLEKVHNNKGATLHAMGRSEEALESYNRAIELKHDYAEAWTNKGNLLYELGRHEHALEAFTNVTRFRPDFAKGWYLRGMVNRRLGKSTQAKNAFEESLRLDPDYMDARKALDEERKTISESYVEVPKIVEDIFTKPLPEEPGPPPPEELPPPPPPIPEDVIARVPEQKLEEIAQELYGDRAELMMMLGRLDEAFEFLGRSLRLEGEDPALLTAAGNVLHRQGKVEAAIRSYEHAISVDSDYVPAIMNLHTALIESGEWDRARELSDSLGSAGTGWQGHALAAIEAAQRRDLSRSLGSLDEAISSESLAALVNFRGLLRLDNGDLDGAIEDFEHAKNMHLDESEAHNNCGVALYLKADVERGDFEKSSMEFDRAIKKRKTNSTAWNNRGCVLYKRDRYRESIACFDESLVIAPSSVAMTNKGFSQLTIDNLEDALVSFEQSLKIGETPEAYNDRGIVLMRMGRYEESLVSLREALRLYPKFKDAAENLKRTEASPLVRSRPAEPSRTEEVPSMEVVGGRDTSSLGLGDLTLPNLRKKRKTELEAICEALGVNPRGTKSELISRISRARKQLHSK